MCVNASIILCITVLFTAYPKTKEVWITVEGSRGALSSESEVLLLENDLVIHYSSSTSQAPRSTPNFILGERQENWFQIESHTVQVGLELC